MLATIRDNTRHVLNMQHITPNSKLDESTARRQLKSPQSLSGRSIPLVTFEAWSSIDMFAFRFVAIGPFLAEINKFYIWPWKFKVKVMAKVKPDGHIWALEFNRYVCFSFRGNRTIFGWDIANSIFDLEKSRSRSRPKSNQVICRSGPTIVLKMKEIQKVVQKLSRGQESAAGAGAGAGVRTGTKT